MNWCLCSHVHIIYTVRLGIIIKVREVQLLKDPTVTGENVQRPLMSDDFLLRLVPVECKKALNILLDGAVMNLSMYVQPNNWNFRSIGMLREGDREKDLVWNRVIGIVKNRLDKQDWRANSWANVSSVMFSTHFLSFSHPASTLWPVVMDVSIV